MKFSIPITQLFFPPSRMWNKSTSLFSPSGFEGISKEEEIIYSEKKAHESVGASLARADDNRNIPDFITEFFVTFSLLGFWLFFFRLQPTTAGSFRDSLVIISARVLSASERGDATFTWFIVPVASFIPPPTPAAECATFELFRAICWSSGLYSVLEKWKFPRMGELQELRGCFSFRGCIFFLKGCKKFL